MGNYLLAAVGVWSWITSVLIAAFLLLALLSPSVARNPRAVYAWVFVLALTVVALGTPSDSWDARSIWLFHAKRIYTDGDLYSQLDGYASWSQNDYPSLVPFLMAAAAKLVGRWNEIFPKALGVVLLLPALIPVLASMKSLLSASAFLLSVTMVGGVYLVNGYMDVLVAIYGVAVLVVAVKVESEEWTENYDYLLLALMTGTLILVKNEAAVVAALVGGVSVARSLLRKRRIPWALVGTFAIAGIPLIFWKCELIHHHVVNDLAGSHFRAQFLSRLPNTFFTTFILEELLARIWIIIPVIIIAGFWRIARPNALIQVTTVVSLAYVGVLYLVYMSTPHDVKWHLQTSVDRTVMPVVLILVFTAFSAAERGISILCEAKGLKSGCKEDEN
jgi:hypothetical protein